MTEDDIRQGFVDRALAVENLNASPARLEEYLALLACSPRETPQMRAEMATMSSCGLVVRGLWARAGVDDSILSYPYVLGHAISDAISIASDAKALRPRESWCLPGDVAILDATADIHSVHALTVVAIDGATITSIDGGELVGGYEGILRRTRQRTSTALDGRAILHWIDCMALWRHYLAGAG